MVTKHHDRPLYVLPASVGKKLILPAPIINHSDTELALIEELVGRTPPFSGLKGGSKNSDNGGDGGNRGGSGSAAGGGRV